MESTSTDTDTSASTNANATNNTLKVKRFDELSVDELYKILQLREAVFQLEQNAQYQDVDGADRESLHVFYVDEAGELAAYLRVLDKHGEPGVAKIARVIAAQRRSGIGRQLMLAGMDVAKRELGASEIFIEAQVQAQGFYEKLGFVACSGVFDDAGIPHIEMRLGL